MSVTTVPTAGELRVQEHRDRVFEALDHDDTALSLNDVVACCGGSVSDASRSLVQLERQGRAHFACGRWSLLFHRSAFISVTPTR